MDKNIKTILLVLGAIVLVSALALGIFMATQAASWRSMQEAYKTTGGIAQEYTEEWTFDYSDGTELRLEMIAVDVEIIESETAAGCSAVFKGTRRANLAGSLPYIRTGLSNGKLRFEEEYPRARGDLFGMFNVGATLRGTLTITVPKTRLSKLNASLVSGDISATGVPAEDTVLETTSGAIRVDAITGRSLQANTVSGAIAMADIVLADIMELESVSGSIQAEGIGARTVKVSTVSGRITLLETETDAVRASMTSGTCKLQLIAPADVNIDAVSGAIDIEMPQDAAFRFEVETLSGRIDIGYSMDIDNKESNRELSGRVGGGGQHEITANTVSGNISISPR